MILYQYHANREPPVGPEARVQGWTGYTGALEGMIAEVSTRGTDRLQRKLSMD
ncbi:hypothetical protein C8A05DRAFT_34744, partial [Staphylotrichum tortipilum]